MHETSTRLGAGFGTRRPVAQIHSPRPFFLVACPRLPFFHSCYAIGTSSYFRDNRRLAIRAVTFCAGSRLFVEGGGRDFNRKPSKILRSNFSPLQGVGCTARFHVSDTRCDTYVICAACLEGRRSIRLSYGRY